MSTRSCVEVKQYSYNNKNVFMVMRRYLTTNDSQADSGDGKKGCRQACVLREGKSSEHRDVRCYDETLYLPKNEYSCPF